MFISYGLYGLRRLDTFDRLQPFYKAINVCYYFISCPLSVPKRTYSKMKAFSSSESILCLTRKDLAIHGNPRGKDKGSKKRALGLALIILPKTRWSLTPTPTRPAVSMTVRLWETFLSYLDLGPSGRHPLLELKMHLQERYCDDIVEAWSEGQHSDIYRNSIW